LAEWASAHPSVVKDQTLVQLASIAGPLGSRPILKLLGSRALTIELDQMQTALTSLGQPYEDIAFRGTERPRIPDTPGARAVLQRLKAEDIVSSFSLQPGRSVFAVSKRH
ncbi:MAG: hypothetical protein WAS54_02360, partial [Scrofimicrobium sp.]